MNGYILALDQGTTSTTALIISETFSVLAKESVNFAQIYPQPGWVEHDPAVIWGSVRAAIAKVLEKSQIDPHQIQALGITNQRETTLIWDRKTGQPVYNAIVWQDRRTRDFCERLKQEGLEPQIQEKTGLVVDPYFSATKIRWILDQVIQSAVREGELAFGTIDTYLLWRLSGGSVHKTDVSNASRTLLMDLRTLAWDDELLLLFGVPKSILPEIASSSEIYGYTRGLDFLPDGIPIAGIAGDQQAALFGQICFAPGMIKSTFGTGSFIVMNIGQTPRISRHHLLTTVAWKLKNQVSYALEGSVFIAGAAVQWIQEGLALISKPSEIEALAQTVENSAEVVFIPALTGLGAPYWRSDLRGIICGLTRDVRPGHIARATLEGIALQNYDVIKAMAEDYQGQITSIKVDGGAASNDLFMQILANLLNIKVIRPKIVETTVLGVSMLAGLAVSFWPDMTAIERAWKFDQEFSPAPKTRAREELLNKWQKAITSFVTRET